MLFAGKWMEVENFMLSKVSKAQNKTTTKVACFLSKDGGVN
jgi:hypothetical protein